MKVTVTQFQSAAASGTTLQAGRDYTEYQEELDDQESILLLEKLGASRSRIFINSGKCTATFELRPDDPISVEITSVTDAFWAISEVSLVEATSIIRVAHDGGDFTQFIPGTVREWDAYGNGR